MAEDGIDFCFQRVEVFNCLGVTITSTCDEIPEIQKIIARASKATGAMRRLLKPKEISRKTKENVYKTAIKPVTTYGSELWRLNIKEMLMELWERKVLRTIYKGKKYGGQWRK